MDSFVDEFLLVCLGNEVVFALMLGPEVNKNEEKRDEKFPHTSKS